MQIVFLLRGLAVGFSIAAPIGPIGVLCIRRTLTNGRIVGFVSGLGAATADAIFGCIAGFGLTAISTILIRQQIGLRSLGGVFLCYFGLKTVLDKPSGKEATSNIKGLLGSYTSTLLLTLTNPMTILSFAAIFTGLGLAVNGGNYGFAGALAAGVFMGSALWWLILCGFAGFLRKQLTSDRLRWVNGFSGMLISGFGIYMLLGVFR
jgi:threonine/homoserine/homoserine lactone efflux protein